jgi:hypothetical protein
MSKLALLFTIILSFSCAHSLDVKMVELTEAGKASEVVAIFDKEGNLDDTNSVELLSLLWGLQITHGFDRIEKILEILDKDPGSDRDQLFVGMQHANLHYVFEEYDRAKEYCLKNTKLAEDVSLYWPLAEYEMLAKIAAHHGKRSEAEEWMAKLAKIEFKILFVSLARDLVERKKQSANAQIFLALNDPKRAEEELNRVLKGKAISEYVFEWTINYLQTDAMKIAEQIGEWTAPDDMDSDWNYMLEANILATYGRVALANKDYGNAVQSLRRFLDIGNIKQIRTLYVRAMADLAHAYHGLKKKKLAEEVKILAIKEIEFDAAKISSKTRKKIFIDSFKL